MVRTRESQVIDAFVELADTLVGDYDLVDFVDVLIVRSVELLEAQAAGILIEHDGQLQALAASDSATAELEVFELLRSEGPCYDAFRSGESVVVESLEDAFTQWPRFAPKAVAHGWASALSVPLRLRSERLGALNLFADRAGAFDDRDEVLARGMADIATIGILQERAVREAEVTAGQLERALGSRVAIEQAKGSLAEQLEIEVDEAFALLRDHARASQAKLSEVAAAVVAGRLRAADLARGEAQPR